jgi:hypothetical protein
MDACGCTDRVNLLRAGHAEIIEETHNQKKRGVSSFSVLVDRNRDKWSVPFICMLPTYKNKTFSRNNLQIEQPLSLPSPGN